MDFFFHHYWNNLLCGWSVVTRVQSLSLLSTIIVWGQIVRKISTTSVWRSKYVGNHSARAPRREHRRFYSLYCILMCVHAVCRRVPIGLADVYNDNKIENAAVKSAPAGRVLVGWRAAAGGFHGRHTCCAEGLVSFGLYYSFGSLAAVWPICFVNCVCVQRHNNFGVARYGTVCVNTFRFRSGVDFNSLRQYK